MVNVSAGSRVQSNWLSGTQRSSIIIELCMCVYARIDNDKNRDKRLES